MINASTNKNKVVVRVEGRKFVILNLLLCIPVPSEVSNFLPLRRSMLTPLHKIKVSLFQRGATSDFND